MNDEAVGMFDDLGMRPRHGPVVDLYVVVRVRGCSTNDGHVAIEDEDAPGLGPEVHDEPILIDRFAGFRDRLRVAAPQRLKLC